jgi:hypothetical protein
MAALMLYPSDLMTFAPDLDPAKASQMIEDAMALAEVIAPCIVTEDFAYTKAAKAILRGAILRWHEAGTGATIQQSAGPFAQSIDTKQQRRGMFWPNEIEQLQNLCKGVETTGAFSIDTAPKMLSINGIEIDPAWLGCEAGWYQIGGGGYYGV